MFVSTSSIYEQCSRANSPVGGVFRQTSDVRPRSRYGVALSGYPVVRLIVDTPENRKRAAEVSMEDFEHATTADLGDGLWLDVVARTQLITGLYDVLKAETAARDERSRAALSEHEAKAAASRQHYNDTRNSLSVYGVKLRELSPYDDDIITHAKVKLEDLDKLRGILDTVRNLEMLVKEWDTGGQTETAAEIVLILRNLQRGLVSE
ncbi:MULTISPECIES: hypothetical protein [Streptosporangium]|nr:hypothetical protein [Streptosporangium brasiliense]